MKKLSVLILALVMAVAFIPTAVFAYTTAPQMTAYNQVIKEGKTVYCKGAAGIYKVKITSKGKVKSKKRIFKSYAPFGKYSYINSMHKKDGYIYFLYGTEGTAEYLMRVSTSGNAEELATLEDSEYGYSIDGDTIYYTTANYDEDWDDEDWDDEDWQLYMKMNLDGSGLQQCDVIPNMIFKKSNASKYSIKIKKKGKYLRDYLKTPKGTYYLGKIKKAH